MIVCDNVYYYKKGVLSWCVYSIAGHGVINVGDIMLQPSPVLQIGTVYHQVNILYHSDKGS